MKTARAPGGNKALCPWARKGGFFSPFVNGPAAGGAARNEKIKRIFLKKCFCSALWEWRSVLPPPPRGTVGGVVRGAEASPAGLGRSAAGSARSAGSVQGAGCPAGRALGDPAGLCPPRPGRRGRRGDAAFSLPPLEGDRELPAAPPVRGRLCAAGTRAHPRRAGGGPGDGKRLKPPSGTYRAGRPHGRGGADHGGCTGACVSVCPRPVRLSGAYLSAPGPFPGPVCPSPACPVQLCSSLPVSHPFHMSVGATGCGDSFPGEQVIEIED